MISGRKINRAISIWLVIAPSVIENHKFMPSQVCQLLILKNQEKVKEENYHLKRSVPVRAYTMLLSRNGLWSKINFSPCQWHKYQTKKNKFSQERAVQKIPSLKVLISYCIRTSNIGMALILYRMSRTFMKKKFRQRFVIKNVPDEIWFLAPWREVVHRVFRKA